MWGPAFSLLYTVPASPITPAPIALAAVAIGLIAACTAPLGDVDFDPEDGPRYAIPLLDTRFTLRDALGDFDFVDALTDSPEGLRLVRRDTLLRRRVLSAVQIPSFSVALTDTVTRVPAAQFALDLPIEEVGIRRGAIDFLAVAEAGGDTLDVTLTLENFVRPNGNPAVVGFRAPPGQLATGVISVGGTALRLDTSRTLTFRYDARDAAGRPVRLSSLLLAVDFIDESYAVGSLERLLYPLGSETIVTDYLEAFEPNTASVRDAAITFSVTSTTRVPLRLFSVGSYAATREGERVPIESSLTDGVAIAPAQVAGQRVTTEILLDGANSTLLAGIQQFPDSLVFDLLAIANPDGSAETYRIEPTDSIIGSFAVDVPLAVDFDGFIISDAIDFGVVDDEPGVDEIELLVQTTSTFGLRARAQVYLLDADGTRVDSLLPASVVLAEAATLDPDGNPVDSAAARALVPLADDVFERFARYPDGEIVLRIDSPEEPTRYAQLSYTDDIALRVGLAFSPGRE